MKRRKKMKKKMRNVMLVIACVAMIFVMVACGKKSGDGSSYSSNYDKLSEEEKLMVGRWIDVDKLSFMDFYSDGTGWKHTGVALDGYEGNYFEWEYDAEAKKYVVTSADISVMSEDENGLYVSKDTFTVEEFTVPEERENIHSFASEGTKVHLAKEEWGIRRFIKTDDCNVDKFGHADEGLKIRTYPDFEDGKEYKIPVKKAKESIAAFRADKDAYKESLIKK